LLFLSLSADEFSCNEKFVYCARCEFKNKASILNLALVITFILWNNGIRNIQTIVCCFLNNKSMFLDLDEMSKKKKIPIGAHPH